MTKDRALTCQELAEFLADYVDGALDADARWRFDHHVAECPDCKTYLQRYRDTIRLAKDSHPDDPAPAMVPEQLVRAILRARPRRPEPPAGSPPTPRRRR